MPSAPFLRRQRHKNLSKGKDKCDFFCTAPRREHTSKTLMYRISQFYPQTPLTEWNIPACSFPAEDGTHLPTPEGWKAELTWCSVKLFIKINDTWFNVNFK